MAFDRPKCDGVPGMNMVKWCSLERGVSLISPETKNLADFFVDRFKVRPTHRFFKALKPSWFVVRPVSRCAASCYYLLSSRKCIHTPAIHSHIRIDVMNC
jgi:hypothetical protein